MDYVDAYISMNGKIRSLKFLTHLVSAFIKMYHFFSEIVCAEFEHDMPVFNTVIGEM